VQISTVSIPHPTLLRLLAAVAYAGAAPALAAQAHPRTPRTIAVDERLASDARLRVGDTVVVAPAPGAAGDTVVIGAVVKRAADPSEVARADYRVRMHLDHLQRLTGYGDRVDRFAVATRGPQATDSVLAAVNRAAFGFRAHRSAEIAVETSKTFLVVSRFHKAIGVITIVASATFLLCILLLKVDERRRDVAALRLMGFSRASIVRAVVLEATLVSALGTLLGVGLGWSISRLVNVYYQGVYRTPLTFALVTPEIVLFAAVLSLVLGIGAGFLAALRLASTPPLALFGR
jgi:putative ABC transport system permease protein